MQVAMDRGQQFACCCNVLWRSGGDLDQIGSIFLKKCIFKPNVVPLCLRELENRDRKKCVLGINPPSEPLTKLLKQSWHFDTDCQPCPGGGHSGQPRIHHHLSLHPCFSAWMD